MNLFEKLYLIRLNEIVKQTYSPNDPIESEQDVIKALIYVTQLMSKIHGEISLEHTSDQVDQYLPGTREESQAGLHLFESNNDIEKAQRNVLLINRSISNFLINNPTRFIEGIDQIINLAETNVQNVRDENVEPLSEITRNLINTFKTILGTFNRMITLVDDHNIELRPNYIKHNPIVF